jgi:hypothetical protein
MLRSVGFAAILLATAAPGLAQRANENAVASAQDAFGTSVGNERVGLYFPQSARGFSPVQAGTSASTACISTIRPTSTAGWFPATACGSA